MSKLPIIYFPLTVVVVDDDEEVLAEVESGITGDYVIRSFTSPADAMAYLNALDFSTEDFVRSVINASQDEDANVQIQIKLEQLSKLADMKEKHTEVGVIVSDYKMPGMNGLDFMRNFECKQKILLTDSHDINVVRKAFNEKIVAKFLPKTDANMLGSLSAYISSLTTDYFNGLTKQIRDNIETVNALPLSDSAFIEIFLNVLHYMNIREYYLIDNIGSMLLIDDKGDRYNLVVHTDASLSEFTTMYDEPEFSAFVDGIIKRNRIPFFHNMEPAKIEPCDWINFMHKPQTICGEVLYYWCVFKEDKALLAPYLNLK